MWIHQDESLCCPGYRRSILYARQMFQAKPAWADNKLINEIYRHARDSKGKVVDHVVPLNHKYVCGLHCEDNLEVITEKANSTKSNNWWPDMWDEQQCLDIPHHPYQSELDI